MMDNLGKFINLIIMQVNIQPLTSTSNLQHSVKKKKFPSICNRNKNDGVQRTKPIKTNCYE